MRFDDTQPKKRKNNDLRRQTVITGLGCGLIAAMLFVGVIAGAGGMYIAMPYLFNTDGTAQAYAQTANALELQRTTLAQTRDANLTEAGRISAAATQQALNALGTQAALDNDAALLQQTATQSARYIAATSTAQSVSNVQQMTQSAMNYQATQAQLQRNATQVELDYRATQNAIYDNATAISNSDVDVQDVAALSIPATDTPAPTLTLTMANTPTPFSSVPTQTPQTVLSTDFSTNSTLTDDYVYDAGQWRSAAGSLFALQANATIETRADYRDFVAVVRIAPNNADSLYGFRIHGENTVYGVALSAQGGRLLNASIGTVEPDGALMPLVTRVINIPQQPVTVEIDTRAGLRLIIDGEILLTAASVDADGSFSVTLPAGAQLRQLEIAQ